MKDFIFALIRFAKHYPDARLSLVYRIRSKTEEGFVATIYTKNRKFAKQFKSDKDIKVQRRLICKTLL